MGRQDRTGTAGHPHRPPSGPPADHPHRPGLAAAVQATLGLRAPPPRRQARALHADQGRRRNWGTDQQRTGHPVPGLPPHCRQSAGRTRAAPMETAVQERATSLCRPHRRHAGRDVRPDRPAAMGAAHRSHRPQGVLRRRHTPPVAAPAAAPVRCTKRAARTSTKADPAAGECDAHRYLSHAKSYMSPWSIMAG